VRKQRVVRKSGGLASLRWALTTAAGVAAMVLTSDAVRGRAVPPRLAGRVVEAPAPPRPSLPHRFSTLFPSAFAMVMATGIIAIDALKIGRTRIGWALFAANMGIWLLLWVAGFVHAVLDPRGLARNLTRHETGPGYLTLVAGTAVLATDFAAFQLATWVVIPLFALSIALWWITQYGFLAGVSEGRLKPPLETGLSGQWLLLVVATQALASLGADVLKEHAGPPGLAFICYAWMLLGCVYYVLLGAIVVYRFAFVAMPPEDLSGPWWINEGSAAITVLAGGKLMTVPGLVIGDFALRDLLSPIVVAFWADATFWIPLLLLLFAWKHLIRLRKLGYAVTLWSVVFPLGMYCAATLQVETAYGLGFLHDLARAFFWVAFLAWCATFAGALLRAGRACLGQASR
jgi:tellurite resistance protein TehA-like permease